MSDKAYEHDLFGRPVDEESTGRKDDTGKLRYDLILPEFEQALAKVLTDGAAKYQANNWQLVDNGTDRYYAALRRHIAAWRMGEENDPEDGSSHLAHAAVNCMFLMWLDSQKPKYTEHSSEHAAYMSPCMEPHEHVFKEQNNG